MIEAHDYRIASTSNGYENLLRNKNVNDASNTGQDNIVLFVHGATYGSTSTFDYPVDGTSWMDHTATQGFDTWCLDLLGYGGSDRPVEMDEPTTDNPPLVDTAHAIAEVAQAIDFILAKRLSTRVSLIGYSWGTAICGAYAGMHPDRVKRLVLSGALWVERGTTPRGIVADLGAYRNVDAHSAMARWGVGLSDSEFEEIVDSRLVKKWCEDVIQCDPKANNTSPPMLRAPSGVLKDFAHCSKSGEPWYDPSLIEAPTQIVVAEYDRETTPEQGRAVFGKLNNAIEKRMTVIGSGTHSLLLERNRQALFEVVASFLSVR
jgi:pimeloyl-ACP methyl ester carboxylesterase